MNRDGAAGFEVRGAVGRNARSRLIRCSASSFPRFGMKALPNLHVLVPRRRSERSFEMTSSNRSKSAASRPVSFPIPNQYAARSLSTSYRTWMSLTDYTNDGLTLRNNPLPSPTGAAHAFLLAWRSYGEPILQTG